MMLRRWKVVWEFDFRTPGAHPKTGKPERRLIQVPGYARGQREEALSFADQRLREQFHNTQDWYVLHAAKPLRRR